MTAQELEELQSRCATLEQACRVLLSNVEHAELCRYWEAASEVAKSGRVMTDEELDAECDCWLGVVKSQVRVIIEGTKT